MTIVGTTHRGRVASPVLFALVAVIAVSIARASVIVIVIVIAVTTTAAVDVSISVIAAVSVAEGAITVANISDIASSVVRD